MIKIKYTWNTGLFNNEQVDGELSFYIEDSLESRNPDDGIIESLQNDVEQIRKILGEFVEMLVEEKILTIEQVEKIF